MFPSIICGNRDEAQSFSEIKYMQHYLKTLMFTVRNIRFEKTLLYLRKRIGYARKNICKKLSRNDFLWNPLNTALISQFRAAFHRMAVVSSVDRCG